MIQITRRGGDRSYSASLLIIANRIVMSRKFRKKIARHFAHNLLAHSSRSAYFLRVLRTSGGN